MAEMTPRLVKVSDFVAEALEAEANRMPPSYKEQADNLRKSAETMRRLGSQKLVRVWEDSVRFP